MVLSPARCPFHLRAPGLWYHVPPLEEGRGAHILIVMFSGWLSFLLPFKRGISLSCSEVTMNKLMLFLRGVGDAIFSNVALNKRGF